MAKADETYFMCQSINQAFVAFEMYNSGTIVKADLVLLVEFQIVT